MKKYRTIKSLGSRLPKGYTELEYIKSTGTQYIDTGITGTTTTAFEIDFKFDEIPTSNVRLCGRDYQQDLYCFALYRNGSNFFSVRASTTQSAGPPMGTVDTNRHYITASLVTSKATNGGNEYDLTNTITNDTTKNILIFNSSDAGYSAMRLYGFILYNNGTLVRNMIPAKNSSDVLGLYDLVSKTFFANDGTGTFIEGPEAVPTAVKESLAMINTSRVPSKYQEIEYIYSTGSTQYINTGFVSNDCTIETDIEYDGGVRTLMGFSGNSGQFWGSSALNKYEIGTVLINDFNSTERHKMIANISNSTLSLTVKDKTISRAIGATITQPYISCGIVTGGGNKIYGIKITSNDIVQRNLIPVKRKSDNKIGMVDTTKTNIFNYNTMWSTTFDDWEVGAGGYYTYTVRIPNGHYCFRWTPPQIGLTGCYMGIQPDTTKKGQTTEMKWLYHQTSTGNTKQVAEFDVTGGEFYFTASRYCIDIGDYQQIVNALQNAELSEDGLVFYSSAGASELTGGNEIVTKKYMIGMTEENDG